MIKIEYFKITKLYGYKTYDFKIKDNSLILVGENGAGKTTILKILYSVLSRQWNQLEAYDFESISLVINGEEYSFKKSDVVNIVDYPNKKYLYKFPPSIRSEIEHILCSNNETELPYKLLRDMCNQYGVSFHSLLTSFERSEHVPSKDVRDKILNLKDSLQHTKILYLPTYRRIEHELKTILKGVGDDEYRSRTRYFHNLREQTNCMELKEFGMKDVTISINDTLETLKEFARERLNSLTLGYLSEVVDKKYIKVDVEQINKVSEETIKNILDRIDDKILSKKSKEHLSITIENVKNDKKLNEHAKVVCHYFIKLMNFQQELVQKENKMEKFCEVCNKYMNNKRFEYISSNFDFSIKPREKTESDFDIKLEQLSSGEKQIVSLFSHIYLNNKLDYFILIDEPELSLSVPWQRQFLVDIKNCGYCSGLVAVTHSPFIFDNELDNYAHGVGEFLSVK